MPGQHAFHDQDYFAGRPEGSAQATGKVSHQFERECNQGLGKDLRAQFDQN